MIDQILDDLASAAQAITAPVNLGSNLIFADLPLDLEQLAPADFPRTIVAYGTISDESRTSTCTAYTVQVDIVTHQLKDESSSIAYAKSAAQALTAHQSMINRYLRNQVQCSELVGPTMADLSTTGHTLSSRTSMTLRFELTNL